MSASTENRPELEYDAPDLDALEDIIKNGTNLTSEQVAALEAIVRLARRAKLAHQNDVTGLPNKRAFLARYSRPRQNRESATEHKERLGAVIGHVALYLDLDGFKGVNDKYGHDQGDRQLVIAAAALMDSVRNDDDEVYHFSGDEFGVVAPLRGSLRGRGNPGGLSLPGRIKKRFSSRLGAIGEGGLVSLPPGFILTQADIAATAEMGVSIGAAYGIGPNNNIIEMMRSADVAMQQAKPTGSR